MVLKGGTGIRKAYFPDYRFSDDLDFTLIEEMNIDELKTKMEDIIKKCEVESEISFVDELNVIENVNGFRIDIYFQISQKVNLQNKLYNPLIKK